MDESANSLAWVFFGTTTFVILSLVYEGIRWIYKSLTRNKQKTNARETES
ncbi:MAG: hypothetical protein KKB91_00880 [Proteobacteria bacterium]|jgi:hypothetical protein|nr:hypothetical protein [Pseudomonadota bacterium]MCG2742999.1 hypothetical protein [Desulfobacteraceae bacterium]MBU4028666.1 hypothetical protein [Pseudomonadota bacterium]MBU4043851.1 hypothetical protein [Pseudomonadota bacterium]MBU4083659.1 hypothetical protein [Pseudomonadota bacterium]